MKPDWKKIKKLSKGTVNVIPNVSFYFSLAKNILFFNRDFCTILQRQLKKLSEFYTLLYKKFYMEISELTFLNG